MHQTPEILSDEDPSLDIGSTLRTSTQPSHSPHSTEHSGSTESLGGYFSQFTESSGEWHLRRMMHHSLTAWCGHLNIGHPCGCEFTSSAPQSDTTLSDRGRGSGHIHSQLEQLTIHLPVSTFSDLSIAMGNAWLYLQLYSGRVLLIVPHCEVKQWCSQLLQRCPSQFPFNWSCFHGRGISQLGKSFCLHISIFLLRPSLSPSPNE